MTCMFRQQPARAASMLGGIMLAAALGACGTSYKVSNVPKLDAITKSEGVFYYLPKTDVHIEAVATEKITKFGRFYDGDEALAKPAEYTNPDGTKGYLNTFKEVYEHNFMACTESIEPPRAKAPEKFAGIEDENIPTPKANYSFTDFAVFTETVPDKSQLYRLEIEPSEFASFSHTVKLDGQGVITGADNLVKDGGTTVAFNLVKSVVGLATTALAKGGLPATANTARCDEFLDFVDLKSGKTEKEEVATLQDKKTALFAGPMQDIDPELVALAIKDIDEQISRLKADNKKQIASQHASTKENSYVVTWKLSPVADAKGGSVSYDTDADGFYELKYELSDEEKKKEKKRITYMPGTAARVLSPVPPAKVPADIKTGANNFTFSLAPDIKVEKKLTENRDGIGTGYRYRIPVRAHLDVIDGNSVTLADANITVAQLGYLAALPSKFKGSSGTLDLVFNANTGALSSAKIGGEPISPTLASDSVDLVTGYKKAKDAADAAKEAEAKAEAEKLENAELDAILAENKLLEAELKRRELRTQLGLPIDDD